VTDQGAWSILKAKNLITPLASGTVPALGTNRWHTLALSLRGTQITAAIDGAIVRSVTNSSYLAGQVGIATSQTINAQFANLSISR
jgi:hypothetical protein